MVADSFEVKTVPTLEDPDPARFELLLRAERRAKGVAGPDRIDDFHLRDLPSVIPPTRVELGSSAPAGKRDELDAGFFGKLLRRFPAEEIPHRPPFR